MTPGEHALASRRLECRFEIGFSDFVVWEWCLGVLSLTKAVAIDCEMVGVGSDGSKSALGRVTLVSTISYFNFLVYLLA